MNEYLTKAIVLLKNPMKETDEMISLYTEQLGKIQIVSKGIRKITSKFCYHLQPINLINCLVLSNRNKHLKGIITENIFSNIRKNELSLNIALKSLKILDNSVIESEKDKNLWNKLNGFLNTLNKLSDENNQLKIESSLIYFLIKLLEILGEIPSENEWKKYFNKNEYLIIEEIVKKQFFKQIDFNIFEKGNLGIIEEKINNIFNNLY